MIKSSNNLQDLPAYFNSIKEEFFIVHLTTKQTKKLKEVVIKMEKPDARSTVLTYPTYSSIVYHNEDNFGNTINCDDFIGGYKYLNILYCLLTKKAYLFLSNSADDVYDTEVIFSSKNLLYDERTLNKELETITISLRRELTNYLKARSLII